MQLGRQNKSNSLTFISTSGAGVSLARGRSNRTAVMSRAPRNTKTTENLGSKGKCYSTAYSFLSVSRARWALPWGQSSMFRSLTKPRDRLSTLPVNLEMVSSQSPSSLAVPVGRIPAHPIIPSFQEWELRVFLFASAES